MSQPSSLWPPHPVTLLLTPLNHLDCTTAVAARSLSLSRQTIYEIIREKQAITASVALRVAKNDWHKS